MNKRAHTNEQKREIIERLFEVWIKNPELRLGQMIWNCFQGQDFFYIEDQDFTTLIEECYKG